MFDKIFKDIFKTSIKTKKRRSSFHYKHRRSERKQGPKEEGVGVDEKLEYDPEDDVWRVEEGTHSKDRKYARSVVEAFYPILYVASLLGLFPLIPYRQKDGTYQVRFSWTSYATILFMISFIMTLFSTFWILCSLICISINSPSHPQEPPNERKGMSRSEEVFVYKRNVLTLVIIISQYIHLTICMVAIFFRRNFIAKQFVYWTEVVELLQLDVGKNVTKKLYQNLITLILSVVGIIAMYALHFSPMLSGAGSTFYAVFWRAVDARAMWHDSIKVFKHVYASFILYVMIGGYIYILWFYYYCRILTNILTIWNNRLNFCLHTEKLDQDKVKEAKEGLRSSNRTTRAQLFQDHLVIFNLLEGVNTQFEVIMESFYLSTMIMIVFETYGFVHAFFSTEFQNCGSRQSDLFPIMLFLGLQLFVYIKVTLQAAGVADEARHVLDIVRRKGMMSSRVDGELWFMLSMRLSFGGHEDVGIIGAGFFYVTKAFLLGAISAITSHFIIFYQFDIPLSQTEEADDNFRHLNTTRIIERLEGVKGTTC